MLQKILQVIFPIYEVKYFTADLVLDCYRMPFVRSLSIAHEASDPEAFGPG
jgi:hypothetical protein